MIDRTSLAAAMRKAAIAAGQAIMTIYQKPFATQIKGDGSPVTEADQAAEAIILAALRVAAPDIPIVSEENAASHTLAAPGRFFLVDPLDGTKEFIKRNGEFTVNIALIEHEIPTLGVVFAPASERLYWTEADGSVTAERSGICSTVCARPAPPEGLTAAVSRSHLDKETTAYLERFKIARELSAGSSLKFCLVAAGEADIYPRFGTTMEWDTAAGDAILRAAGGRMVTPEGAPFRYGKPGFRNTAYIALGKA